MSKSKKKLKLDELQMRGVYCLERELHGTASHPGVVFGVDGMIGTLICKNVDFFGNPGAQNKTKKEITFTCIHAYQ